MKSKPESSGSIFSICNNTFSGGAQIGTIEGNSSIEQNHGNPSARRSPRQMKRVNYTEMYGSDEEKKPGKIRRVSQSAESQPPRTPPQAPRNNDKKSNLNGRMEISLDYDIDFDNFELDNIGSDPNPNIEPELLGSIAFQEQLKKYPEQVSSNDEWILPSGKSIHEIIRGPRSLHKSHPSCLGIIRVGPKIRKPDWIEEVDWNYQHDQVHSSIVKQNDIRNYFSSKQEHRRHARTIT